MNSKTKFIFLLIMALLIIIGALVLSFNLFLIGNTKIAVFVMIMLISLIGILSIFVRKCYYDLKAGIPSDDLYDVRFTWKYNNKPD